MSPSCSLYKNGGGDGGGGEGGPDFRISTLDGRSLTHGHNDSLTFCSVTELWNIKLI
jgi:hypothetical protein